LDHFSDEVQKLFDNARTYYQPKSDVFIDADELEVVFRESLAEHSQALLGMGCGMMGGTSLAGTDAAKGDLFNKVVMLKPKQQQQQQVGDAADAEGGGDEGGGGAYKLYFVLTYIPDLQWCRLGPMEIRGAFNKRAGAYSGQPKWMLAQGEHLEVLRVKGNSRGALLNEEYTKGRVGWMDGWMDGWNLFCFNVWTKGHLI
jgi:hypothetical protein